MRNFIEYDLEEIIYGADRNELIKRGLDISENAILFRQKKIGNYGISDLISVEKQCTPIECKPYLNINIIELKKDKIGISAFLQAAGYAKGIHSYLIEKRMFYNYKLGITLIGSSIDTSGSFCFLPDMIKSLDVFSPHTNGEIDHLTIQTYSYKIDGIYFKTETGYSLTDEGF